MEAVLAASFLDELPAALVGDKAYDSEKLDEKLTKEYHIELIARNRQRRSKSYDAILMDPKRRTLWACFS